MVDHQHAGPAIDQGVQRLEHPGHVLAVEPRARLVEEVEHALLRAAERPGQLHPLRLAPGERGQWLADGKVPEPEPLQRPERLGDGAVAAEGLEDAVHRHLQHLGDRVTGQANLQHLRLEAPAAAAGTGERDVGQELHLHRLAPSPEQASQRPPSTLKEKWAGPKPRSTASGSAAKRLRSTSQALV